MDTYFNKSQAARAIEVSDALFRYHLRMGYIQQPTHRDPTRERNPQGFNTRYYNEEELEQLRQHFAQPDNRNYRKDKFELLSLSDVAEMFGANKDRLRRAVGLGKMPRPTHRCGQRTYYHRSEVEALRYAWEQREVPKARLYTIKETCDMLGVAPITFDYHLRKEKIKSPGIDVGGKMCYTTEEVYALWDYFQNNTQANMNEELGI